MLDHILKAYLLTGGCKESFEAIKYCGEQKLSNLGLLLGEYFSSQFPMSVGVLTETAGRCFELKQFEKCYNYNQKTLDCLNLPEQAVKQITHNQGLCVPFLCDRYCYYNPEIVEKIVNRPKKTFPKITFTITTCKRFKLFEQTMNSFLNCCIDLDMIDAWICVDDNSSLDDREKMKKLYPFFQFHFKNKDEKGHPQSMNIIRRSVRTPFIFHMEDDWKFFVRRNYMSDCLDVLNQNPQIGQCLINRNYAETDRDTNIAGGLQQKTESGLRFLIHEHCDTPQKYMEFQQKYGSAPNSAYWPHFSFRPGLNRSIIWRVLGEFDEKVSHFEHEYSKKYKECGFVTAFLDNIHCLHTGRLTSERWDTSKENAYTLNEEKQFAGKEDETKHPPINLNIKTVVINLDRRPDRWSKFCQQEEVKCLKYQRFSAVDGSRLKPNPQLQRIFEGNDYNMREGIVGCAMSHIKLYIELINSSYDAFCILEDDLDFVPKFREKFLRLYESLPVDWDMCYLGHHLWKEYREDKYGFLDKTKQPVPEKWDVAKSFLFSMGGTGGYLISKKGAKAILELINRIGMTNGIDTMQQKFANVMQIYYANPHLIYSDVWTPDNKQIDTDIQKNHVSLDLDESRMEECKQYTDRLKKNGEFNIDDALEEKPKLKTSIISFGDTTHVKEAIDQVGIDKKSYPFDTVDGGNLEKFVQIAERVKKMTDNEIREFISHDFCNLQYNEVYVQSYNQKMVIKNKEYNISFPHEDVNKLVDIYTERFMNLANVMRDEKGTVLVVHASRWETYSEDVFERLKRLFSCNVKILSVNSLEKVVENITLEKVDFPLHLRVEGWPDEKVAYDQSRYRVELIPVVEKFVRGNLN